MRKQPGRKAFILLSDGVSFHNQASLEPPLSTRSGRTPLFFPSSFPIIQNTIGPAVWRSCHRRPAPGESAMQRLARETSGAFFEVSDAQPIIDIYAQIEETLRNQYALGYTPQTAGKSGQYHKITLATKTSGLGRSDS